MDPLTPFEGCWQRIKRAEAHRNAFAEAWNSFADTDAYDVVLHINDYGHGGMWLEPRHITLPTDFSLQIGEILYQLRAALDGSIYASAILDTGQDPPPGRSGWSSLAPIVPTSSRIALGTLSHSIQGRRLSSSAYSRTTSLIFLTTCLLIISIAHSEFCMIRRQKRQAQEAALHWFLDCQSQPTIATPGGCNARQDGCHWLWLFGTRKQDCIVCSDRV
jgi:hypothetical protein